MAEVKTVFSDNFNPNKKKRGVKNLIFVPDRRSFVHVNVICMYNTAVLVGRGGMGVGVEQEGLKMGQLTLGKRPVRMGSCNHV
jgi:hypothetical protein